MTITNNILIFDRTVLTDIHIQHNRPDIIILNKQQKQAYLLDIAVPNSHNITQTYNTKINKYLKLSAAEQHSHPDPASSTSSDPASEPASESDSNPTPTTDPFIPLFSEPGLAAHPLSPARSFP
jgi:hypothetical protein